MKNILAIVLIATSLLVQAQIQAPQPSPAASVSTVVGLTDVKIDYSRPRAKGRKIFGAEPSFVVPFGAIWRTGANSGTKITFSDNVKVEGIDVPKGEYLIFTWPGAAEWTISLYKDIKLGGNTEEYDKTQEAANFKVKSEKLTEKVETLTFNISDIANDGKSAKVQLTWENTSVKFTVGVDFDAKVMKSIEANTKVNPGNLFQAASYYYDNGKDSKQALEWATAAGAANADAFWVFLLKAKIQKSLGDKKGAMDSSMASKAAAEKAKNTDYMKQNDEFQKGLK